MNSTHQTVRRAAPRARAGLRRCAPAAHHRCSGPGGRQFRCPATYGGEYPPCFPLDLAAGPRRARRRTRLYPLPPGHARRDAHRAYPGRARRERRHASPRSWARRWTRSSPWTRRNGSSSSTAPRKTMFHCGRDEALGANLDRFIPAPLSRAAPRARRAVRRTGVTRRRMGASRSCGPCAPTGRNFRSRRRSRSIGGREQRLFTVILRDITQRKARRRCPQAQQVELRELSARMLEAREDERLAIARELHDELGQLLTALKMDLAWLREPRACRPGAESATGPLQMGAALDQTVTSMRRIAADLRPLMLDDLGLADAAGWLVEDFAQRSGVACTSTSRPDERARRTRAKRRYRRSTARSRNRSPTSRATPGRSTPWIQLGIRGRRGAARRSRMTAAASSPTRSPRPARSG